MRSKKSRNGAAPFRNFGKSWNFIWLRARVFQVGIKSRIAWNRSALPTSPRHDGLSEGSWALLHHRMNCHLLWPTKKHRDCSGLAMHAVWRKREKTVLSTQAGDCPAHRQWTCQCSVPRPSENVADTKSKFHCSYQRRGDRGFLLPSCVNQQAAADVANVCNGPVADQVLVIWRFDSLMREVLLLSLPQFAVSRLDNLTKWLGVP